MRGKWIIGLMIILLLSNFNVYADRVSGIDLDGDFHDWEDKPFVKDTKHDIRDNWMDFVRLGYFADEEYLYLQADRLSAKKSEPWHFSVVVLNGTRGDKLPQYIYGNPPVYAPQFEIEAYYNTKKSADGLIVDVSFQGQLLESTISGDNNGKSIEFRVPLELVGLAGKNKEVKFMLKSDEDSRGELDWVSDNCPIIITTGPTLYEATTIVFFGGVSYAAYRIIKRKKQKTAL